MSKDYTQYEYESLVERITELYKDKEGLGGGYASTVGQTLIELLADATDNLHFMLERRTQEAYTTLARLDSSVRTAASEIGYLPRRRISSTGTLRLTLVDSDENPISTAGTIHIPYGTSVTFDGENFIVAEDVQILPGDSTVSIPVIEGVIRTRTFNMEENPYYENNFIVIPEYIDIEEFSLKVFNVGEEYYFVDDTDQFGSRIGALSFATSDYPAYDLKYTSEGMRIVFGDGTYGKRPTGDVTVTWIESKGREVNVINTDLEFKFENKYLYDDMAVTPRNQYEYKMVNISPISGGRDEETIQEIQQSLTEYLRTNDRAVTNFDYAFRVRRSGIGNIVDVNVYGEHENNTIIFTMNNVYVAYVTADRIPLNTAQQIQLREYIDRYKVNTTHIVLKPALETPLRLNIELKRHPSLPISDAQLYRDVRAAVYDYFAVKKGTIGKEFQHSEFVEYLQNLRTVFNGITYPVTDFVNVTASVMFPFTVPTPTYDGIIELSTDYTVNRDDVWSVTVDGVTFSEVVRQSDTVESIVLRMRQKIFSNTNLMVATPQPNQIRLKHPEETGTFTVSVGSGDLVEYSRFRQLIQLPKTSQAGGLGTTPHIRAGSATIYDSSDVPIMKDIEGNGVIESLDGYFFPEVLIDYQQCLMELPSLPVGTYYVDYQQNQYMNFSVARDGYVGISPIKTYEQLDSPEVFFSNIRLL